MNSGHRLVPKGYTDWPLTSLREEEKAPCWGVHCTEPGNKPVPHRSTEIFWDPNGTSDSQPMCAIGYSFLVHPASITGIRTDGHSNSSDVRQINSFAWFILLPWYCRIRSRDSITKSPSTVGILEAFVAAFLDCD
jgi:hypothetical protein